MSALKEMYRQVVTDHSRKPRHFGPLPGATHTESGLNPSCGDQIQLMLRLGGGRIEQAQFTGRGCAISVASASLMTSMIQGKTIAEALSLAEQFSRMMQTGESTPQLGESAALQGVHTLHTRVKCATLSWQTLKVLLEQASAQASA